MRTNFFELNSKGPYQSSEKEKESRCHDIPSSIKREIRHFHIVVVQQRQLKVQKNRDARDRGRISSVGRTLDCRAGGRGFDSRGWTITQGLKMADK